MKNMINLRKLFKVFGRGSMEFLRADNRKVLAYVRRWGEDIILCVCNFSRFAQPAQLDLSEFAGHAPVEMFGYTEFPRIGETPYSVTLGPYGYYWFELSPRP
jgi:maltose alpha-D-glucosyltransferase/alpha-amylase